MKQALVVSAFLVLLPGVAVAQDEAVTSSGDVEGSADDASQETEYRGRFYTSGTYFKESGTADARRPSHS